MLCLGANKVTPCCGSPGERVKMGRMTLTTPLLRVICHLYAWT